MSRTVKIYFCKESWDAIEALVMYDRKGKELSRSQKIRSLVTNKLDEHQLDNYPMFEVRKRLHRLSMLMYDGVLESEPIENLSDREKKILRCIRMLEEWKQDVKQHSQRVLKGWDME